MLEVRNLKYIMFEEHNLKYIKKFGTNISTYKRLKRKCQRSLSHHWVSEHHFHAFV